MKGSPIRTVVLATAVCSLPLTAGAQSAGLEVQQVQDVLTFQAGLTLETHSNLFQLDSDIPDSQVRTLYGDTSRSDTTISGNFGVKFDRDFSLQRVTISGTLLPTKHFNYSQFDYVGYDAGLNWDWAIGRPWFGKLGVKFGQRLSSFADIQQSDKNLKRTTDFYLTAGMRLTPSWSLLSGLDVSRLSNSTVRQEASDYRFTGLELGARFAPGTGTEFDFLIRNVDGKYPNRQLFNSVGQPLLLINQNGIDNAFTERSLLVRMQYKPSNDTVLGGEVGFTQRKFDNFSSRDFSGPTAKLTLNWRPGGAFYMGVDLIRDLNSEEVATANFVDSTRLNLRPSFRLTGKTSLNGLLSFDRRDFGGDPGFATTTAPVREDSLNTIGLRADWQYSRNILFQLGFTRSSRSSNYQNLDYTDNVLTFTGRLSL